MMGKLTTVIRTPPLNADIKLVTGSYIRSQSHTLVIDILCVSYPDLTERAGRDLKTKKRLYSIRALFSLAPHTIHVDVPVCVVMSHLFLICQTCHLPTIDETAMTAHKLNTSDFKVLNISILSRNSTGTWKPHQ